MVRKVAWIFAALAVSALSLVVARQFLVYLPADHFCGTGKRNTALWRRVARWIAGLLLIVLGVVLAIPGVPGQGLLLILIGVVLLDLPVLRGLELRLLRVPVVAKSVNALRKQANRPPLQLPDADPPR